METFSSLDGILTKLLKLGAERVYYKQLRENDNSKQQIYLCDRPSAIPFLQQAWVIEDDAETPKLDLDLYWVNQNSVDKAPNAKLIYYPAYPEVRLSGVLKGCRAAPSKLMQPIPGSERTGSDDRILFIGSAPDNKLYCHVSTNIRINAPSASNDPHGILRQISFNADTQGPSFKTDEQATAADMAPAADTPDRLPYWAAIAFVAECTRLLSTELIADNVEPSSLRAAVADALKACRHRSTQGGRPTDPVVVTVDDAYFDPYDIDALKTMLAGLYSSTWRTYTDLADDPEVGPVSYRYWLCIHLASQVLDSSFPDSAEGGKTVLDHLAAAESAVASEPELEAAIWPNLYHIRKLSSLEAWTDESPVPPSVFAKEARSVNPTSLRFRPRARIIRTIGDRLISGPEAAVIELVKNSYDADASEVKICFFPRNEVEPSRIVFEDNGHGMSFSDIQHKWMEPATSDKGDRLTSPAGRRLLGSKGIGRFASARLGRRLALTSTKRIDAGNHSPYETSTIDALDWSVFDQTEYLEDVSFAASTGRSNGPSGTILHVLDLRDEWNEKSLEKLYLELRRLLSPLDDDREAFKIIFDLSACTLKSCGFDGTSILRRSSGMGDQRFAQDNSFEVRPFPILDACDYLVDGIFDESGDFEGTFTIRREGRSSEHVKLSVPAQDNERPCGIVLVKLSVFDREAASIRSTAEKAGFGHLGVRDARKLLDGVAGVAIYRDNFRVRPYGDAENDWLTLDAKRVQNPTQKIGRNQIAGVIVIEGESSSNLIERSSREGLEENGSYRRLQSLVLNLLAEEIEPRRRNYRIDSGLERRRNSGISDALSTASLEWAQKIIERLPPQDRPEAQKIVNSESSKLTYHLRDLAERQAQLEAQATLGLIIGEVMHQGNTPLTFIENEVERLINWWPTIFEDTEDAALDREETPRMLNGMNASAISLRSLFDALSPLAGAKRGNPSEYSLLSTIQDIIFLFRTRADSLDIEFEVDRALAGINVTGYPADIATALTNLFDNAIYWLSHHNVARGKISVSLIESGRNDVISMTVKDSGRGVPQRYFSSIFDVGFSTKPNGTGLGLSIAREAMFRSGGDLTITGEAGRSEFILTLPSSAASAQ